MTLFELTAATLADFIADDAEVRVVGCSRPQDEFSQYFFYPALAGLLASLEGRAPLAVHDVGHDGGLFVADGPASIPYFAFLRKDGSVGDVLVSPDSDAVLARVEQILAEGWSSRAELDAEALLRAGDHQAALVAAQTALSSAVRDPLAWGLVCRVLFSMGARADAYERLQGALEAFPDDVALCALHAGELTADHQYPAALASWQRLHALQPTDPWATLGIARCLLNQGDEEGARVEVGKALACDPGLADEIADDPELGQL